MIKILDKVYAIFNIKKCGDCGEHYYDWDDHFLFSNVHHQWIATTNPEAYTQLVNEGLICES